MQPVQWPRGDRGIKVVDHHEARFHAGTHPFRAAWRQLDRYVDWRLFLYQSVTYKKSAGYEVAGPAHPDRRRSISTRTVSKPRMHAAIGTPKNQRPCGITYVENSLEHRSLLPPDDEGGNGSQLTSTKCGPSCAERRMSSGIHRVRRLQSPSQLSVHFTSRSRVARTEPPR